MEEYGRYGKPVDLGHGVYWVGTYDEEAHIHCNPYLIKEGDRALLIDGGSRGDFPAVMLKVLQTGVEPRNIDALIYQHYDPDLCGSLPNFIGLCDNPDLQVLSTGDNNDFISFYLNRDQGGHLRNIEELDWELSWCGRTLRFVHTPYAHAAGGFVTHDEKSGVLFSSDLFGSFATHWDLFLSLEEACYGCPDHLDCPQGKTYCPVPDILDFHRRVMPSGQALSLAMARIAELDVTAVAPQHGGILPEPRDVRHIAGLLDTLEGVGIASHLPPTE